MGRCMRSELFETRAWSVHLSICSARLSDEMRGAVSKQLASIDAATRLGASVVLARYRDRGCVQAIAELLGHEDQRIVRDALELLPCVADCRFLPALHRLIARCDDTEIIAKAIQRIPAYGDTQSIPHLLPFLQHTDSKIRHAAIWALQKLQWTPQRAGQRTQLWQATGNGSHMTLDEVLEALASPDLEVTRLAAMELASRGTAPAVQALLEAVSAEDALLREISEKAIRWIRNDESIPALISATRNLWPGVATIDALERFAPAAACTAISSLFSEEARERSQQEWTGSRAGESPALLGLLQTLARIGSSNALSVLIEAVSCPGLHESAEHAATELGMRSPALFAARLRRGLAADDLYQRFFALRVRARSGKIEDLFAEVAEAVWRLVDRFAREIREWDGCREPPHSRLPPYLRAAAEEALEIAEKPNHLQTAIDALGFRINFGESWSSDRISLEESDAAIETFGEQTSALSDLVLFHVAMKPDASVCVSLAGPDGKWDQIERISFAEQRARARHLLRARGLESWNPAANGPASR